MPKKLSPAEQETTPEHGQEHDARLDEIGRLIRQCQDRMSGVSNGILSDATRAATVDMYKGLLREAEENAAVREERLSWMRENVQRLNETIVKAAQERERFESDLSQAMEKKWIAPADVSKWMREFDKPDLLEMYRSQWLKETWEKKYKEGWKRLADDRERVLKKAARLGVTAKDVPELAVVERDDAFLSKDRNFHARRSLVDALDAAIDAAVSGKLGAFRRHETLLAAASTGKNRALHPAKVGAWLQKIQSDPARYTPDVVREYVRGWQAARVRYDELSKRYADEGRPEGCAPLNLNGFLELPYDSRLATLHEWANRLDAAKRLRTLKESNVLERAKLEIRRSIDLKDYDAAERDLEAVRREHPEDRDVRSISAHLEAVRAREERREERSNEERTNDALEGLREVRTGVPAAVAAHYAHILESGDPEKAATFFRAMKLRGERRLQGETTDDDEREISETAELIESAVVLDGKDEDDAAQVVVTEGTPPAETLSLLREQQNGRSPALVIEGVSFAQQWQLVQINERVLADMRHLQNVGDRGSAKREAVAA